MDSRQQADLGRRLDEGCRTQSLVFEKAIGNGPNIAGWERVDGATVIGKLLAATGGRWRVRDSSEAASRARFEVSDGGQTS